MRRPWKATWRGWGFCSTGGSYEHDLVLALVECAAHSFTVTPLTEVLSGMKFSLILFVVLLASVWAYGADVEGGKQLAKSRGCTECHGLRNTGYNGTPPIPNNAGQPKVYLIKVMTEYRSGERIDKTMNLIMKSRSDEDIERLAEYFSSQKRF